MATTWWHDQAGRYPLLSPSQEIQLGQVVRAWLDHPPPAPPAVERRGRRARERFIRANLRLVLTFAERYRGIAPNLIEDLHQAGNEGLIRAVEKYDPARGYRFSTYAYWWIRQAINAHLDQHRSIRLPTTHAAQFARIQEGRRQLCEDLGRSPTRPELADHLGWTVAALERVLARPAATMSLDESVPWLDDAGTISEVIADPSAVHPLDLLDQQELHAEISRLPLLTQRIIEGHYIYGDGDNLSELAKQEGMTRTAIRQQLAYGLHKLKQAIRPESIVTPPPLQQNPSAVQYTEQLTLTFRS